MNDWLNFSKEISMSEIKMYLKSYRYQGGILILNLTLFFYYGYLSVIGNVPFHYAISGIFFINSVWSLLFFLDVRQDCKREKDRLAYLKDMEEEMLQSDAYKEYISAAKEYHELIAKHSIKVGLLNVGNLSVSMEKKKEDSLNAVPITECYNGASCESDVEDSKKRKSKKSKKLNSAGVPNCS